MRERRERPENERGEVVVETELEAGQNAEDAEDRSADEIPSFRTQASQHLRLEEKRRERRRTI
jgi:hypothetical protein